MAQENIALEEPPAASSAIPSSPTKSLWKRLLARSSSAHSEQNDQDVSPERQSYHPAVPLPTLHIPEAAAHPIPVRDSSEGRDVIGNGYAVAPRLGGPSRRSQRNVVPNLPRTQTFARQQAELRENLLEVMPTPDERRAASVDRRLSRSVSSPTNSHVFSNPRSSAPSISHHQEPRGRGLSVPRSCALPEDIPPVPPIPASSVPSVPGVPDDGTAQGDASVAEEQAPDLDHPSQSPQRFTFAEEDRLSECLDQDAFDADHLREPFLIDTSSMTSSEYEQRIRYELEQIWILNLSMHFRDRSRREKFFVTYRQNPDLTRRVTISLDYRNAPEGSLEMDLMNTKVQRDKNEMIYEAIRESLIDIQFYDTVTNLKLQTTEGRLHVHVVEDVTEIIDYPSGHFVHHLGCRKIRERDVEFESHMSGFVYKVRVDGKTLIKKEIPGPDSVDEFLYEVNALNFLRGSHNVIELYGIVIGDDDRVKGLLISYAEQGALIDILYENNHGLPWPTRMKWARQIVHGLSEVHEAGFVQGDFTLSNIVIDDCGDAKIIDINRRGCPVGWEPPEATPLIQSEQRISMYIGVKSDLYQLGMVLWSLATQYDDPEAHGRPLHLGGDIGVPQWYQTIVETCLAEDPRVRAQARQLLSYFPSPSNGSGQLDDSDGDDDWADGRHHPAFYAQSAVSGSLDDGRDSFRHRAGIESAASSEYNADGIEHPPKSKGGHPADLAPRIKSVTPSNEWSYVNFGHTYVDPLNGVSNEPYYYPTRGRSPPSSSRAGTLHGSAHHEDSPARTRSVENRCPTPPPLHPGDDLRIGYGMVHADGDDTISPGEPAAETTATAGEAAEDDDKENENASRPIEFIAIEPTSEPMEQDDSIPLPDRLANEQHESSATQQDDALDTTTEGNEDAPASRRSTDVRIPALDTNTPPNLDTSSPELQEPDSGCIIEDSPCGETRILDQSASCALGTKDVPVYLDRHENEKQETHDNRHVDADSKLPALVTA